ncbi:MAG: zinc ABC transporter substrate-binding protein [Thermoguttaceae bacterium]|nr:zinc ABC transporter substrate-binding protein [Thermoguttaceae bacterium]
MFWSKFHIISALLIGLMVLCLLSSCEMVPKNVRNGRKTVCASFYLLADFAQKIVGDEMDVVCVMPPGADVHSWEPTPKKVLEMTRADAFLMNGAELEEWTEKVHPLLKKRKIPVFVAANSVELGGTHECSCGHHHDADDDHDEHDHDHEHHHDAHEHHDHDHAHGADPHIWLSVRNMKKILADLTDFFCELDPKNAETFRANAAKYEAECDALDADFEAVTKNLKNRKLVVAHSAFWYLCRDYGLEQVALEGYSAYSDPSPAQMVKIIAFIRENQIPVIYAASSESSKGAETIARETGVKVGVLHPLGSLTQAQLDAGADYFSVMRENLEALKFNE